MRCHKGALEIIPVATVEEAFQMAKVFPRGSILLGGERESKKIQGFDLGNSPKEYVAERVKGKKLILTTTNGTKAFHLVSSGKEILVGSFFNIGAIAQRCLELDRDLLIFPSGDEGRFFSGRHDLRRNVDRIDHQKREETHFFDRCLPLRPNPLSKI